MGQFGLIQVKQANWHNLAKKGNGSNGFKGAQSILKRLQLSIALCKTLEFWIIVNL
jgi:hypothetical protein